MAETPPIAIIMGSQSDWATMRHAAETLDRLGVSHDDRIVSAHRTPDRLYDFAKGAKAAGYKVIIAGAGGAAHLPGMAAALTPLPVFGVPVESKALSGVDSLHSIVQMRGAFPSGRWPSASPARSTPRCSPRPCSRSPTRRSPGGSTPSARPRRPPSRRCRPMSPEILKPGATVGILGGGQLGRMIALAAARLGLRVHVFCPDPASPAFDVAAAHTVAAYDDEAALAAFAAVVDVVTYEFENVPAATAALLAAHRPLFPDARALATAQDRIAEKTFLREAGVAVADFAAVDGEADIDGAIAVTGLPAILKTRRFGYDGKGQAKVSTREELVAALAKLGGRDCVLERLVPFALEVSAIVVRGRSGGAAVYAVGENRHENHILKETRVPARVSPETAAAAVALGGRIADALGYVGVLGVEMFVVRDGAGERLLVNELAPRVHNSGHWTEDGAVTSQFENHVRAIAGWPLGSVASTGDVTVMENLIGDEASAWLDIVADPEARLHLYGKAEARPGRKMGHVNRVTRR